MAEDSGGGFTALFSKLCEISFSKEARNGWDTYRRPRFTDRRQKALKLCLYETLFEELRAPFVSELARTRHKSKQGNSPFLVSDKLSIAAFKLRLARRFDDADKLDHLVRLWSDQKEWLSSTIDFSITDMKTVLESDAVLRFLVALSGSATDNLTGVLGHQSDSWSKLPRQIQKTSLPQGPLLITDSQLLRQRALEFDHYIHYSRFLAKQERRPVFKYTQHVDPTMLDIKQE